MKRFRAVLIALLHPEAVQIIDRSGAYSKNFFYAQAIREIARVSREFQRGTHRLLKTAVNGNSIRLQNLISLSVIFVDLDGLKKINDNQGHSAGDKYIKQFADAVKSQIRPYDIFGRWGGDEFVILLPGADITQTEGIAERISKIFPGFSFGISQWREGNSFDDMVSRADSEMYQQKREKKEKKELNKTGVLI
jgi:diguanylate cyclase (GGDEF)-like protein